MTKSLATITALIALTIPTIGSADDHATEGDSNPPRYFAVLAGPAITTNSANAGDTHFTFGGHAGYSFLTSAIGSPSIGVHAQFMSDSERTSSAYIESSITTIMAELTSRRLFGSGLYMGGRFGIGLLSLSLSGISLSASTSTAVFAVAPVLGYEQNITENVAIALDFSWQVVGSGTFKFSSGTSLTADPMGMALLQGGIAFHF